MKTRSIYYKLKEKQYERNVVFWIFGYLVQTSLVILNLYVNICYFVSFTNKTYFSRSLKRLFQCNDS